MSNQKTRRHQKIISLLFGFIDIAATILTLFLACFISNNFTQQKVVFDQQFIIVSFIVILTWVILLKATHLARVPRTSAIPVLLSDFIKLTLIGSGLLLFLDLVIELDRFPSLTLAIFILMNFFTLFIVRILTYKLFKRFRASGHNVRNLVIIANDDTVNFINKIIQQKEWGYKILHVITDSKIIRQQFRGQFKIYPRNANIKSLIKFDIVDEVICCDCQASEKRFYELVEFCHGLGVTFGIPAGKGYTCDYKTRIQYFDKMPFLIIENNPVNRIEHIIKTVTETIAAFWMIFILSPFMLFIAVIIKCTSRGPVIFKQKRVGLRGRKFYIYKFRTMVYNAEELKAMLLEQNESDGPTFKIKKDPRITFIGKILRKTNLDELPQLFNVIKGEMSLIGPRPLQQWQVARYEDWQLKRLSVKPGLTCTWQIQANRYKVKFDNWMQMDINYIDNWSLKSDISLFFKTFKTVLFARGA